MNILLPVLAALAAVALFCAGYRMMVAARRDRERAAYMDDLPADLIIGKLLIFIAAVLGILAVSWVLKGLL